MTGRAQEGHTNKETCAVGLFLNSDQTRLQLAHATLRAINWDRELEGKVILINAKSIERVKARHAGEVLRNLVDTLLTPHWSVGPVDYNRPTDAAYLKLTADQNQAKLDIGSMWRVDWYQLGAAFMQDLI